MRTLSVLSQNSEYLSQQITDMDKGGERPTPSKQDCDDNNEEDIVENEEGTQQQGERQIMATTSSLAGENHVVVYDPGRDRRPPIQETGDDQQLAQLGLNPNIMAYGSGATPELEGVIIGQRDSNGLVEVSVMSVETSPAIVNEL
ncbi:Hypothetical predicted protein [Paramuricea clavata]|uniref:Uncharacterized protein n=1 Tax=Paramuricea clavata TaxID=317549 RepID=A0A6S7GV02_PARCT|nr:Hypothetical predicted protein [Paramuricea clavata]